MSESSKRVHLVEPIDVNRIPIRRDPFLAGAFVIELPLDSQPDYVWRTFFEQEWKSSLHLWERKAVVVGEKLLLITPPTEVGEKIEWLKRMIEATNVRVEEFNKTQRVIRAAEEEEEWRKHENVIRDELRIKLSIA